MTHRKRPSSGEPFDDARFLTAARRQAVNSAQVTILMLALWGGLIFVAYVAY